MKKFCVLGLIMIFTMTGCGTSGLESYTEAMEATEAYDSGVCRMDMHIELEFNEEGLNEKVLRDLSYFERMDQICTITFLENDAEDRVVVENYSSFGGLGFDMIYYYDDGKMLVELPIMDRYLDFDLATYNDESSDAWEMLFESAAASWRDILEEEDVVVGKKGYVMTDQGQIKATTYTIDIDSEQFDRMKEDLISELEKGRLAKMLEDSIRAYGGWDEDGYSFGGEMARNLSVFELEHFDGKAYVDFDGRLVRQTTQCDLINEGAEPGMAKRVSVTYEITYDQLGEIETIEIPAVKADDILEPEDGQDFVDFFPEGLFE